MLGSFVVWYPHVGILCGCVCRVCPVLPRFSIWTGAMVGVAVVLSGPSGKVAAIGASPERHFCVWCLTNSTIRRDIVSAGGDGLTL